MADNYVPDKLWARLFQPWTLPESEWTLAREDWTRVDVIAGLPWHGALLDFGAGDGTLAAMVCSRNPAVSRVFCVEQDARQREKIQAWAEHAWPMTSAGAMPPPCFDGKFDGALVCEVLEHLTPEAGLDVLRQIRAVLSPGAMLCVTVPYPGGSRQDFPGHIRKLYGDDLKRDLDAAGFKLSMMRFIDDDHLRPIWLMAVAHAA